MPKFQKAYAPTVRPTIACTDEDGNHDGRTEQHHIDTVNINNIIKRYKKTGLIEHVAQSAGQYGDYTTVNEYQQSLNLVKQAQENFMQVPAKIRTKFGNDPGRFFEFVTNPANQDEMIKMGLATDTRPQIAETENQSVEA